ncbi:MAG: hypothetical protein ACRDE5_15535, partial [Ginsengibacter sp.]
PELLGFRDALIELCVPVNLNPYSVLDIVGTGGDGKNTFNISTLSCFIVAGTGQKSCQAWQLRCIVYKRCQQCNGGSWL